MGFFFGLSPLYLLLLLVFVSKRSAGASAAYGDDQTRRLSPAGKDARSDSSDVDLFECNREGLSFIATLKTTSSHYLYPTSDAALMVGVTEYVYAKPTLESKWEIARYDCATEDGSKERYTIKSMATNVYVCDESSSTIKAPDGQIYSTIEGKKEEDFDTASECFFWELTPAEAKGSTYFIKNHQSDDYLQDAYSFNIEPTVVGNYDNRKLGVVISGTAWKITVLDESPPTIECTVGERLLGVTVSSTDRARQVGWVLAKDESGGIITLAKTQVGAFSSGLLSGSLFSHQVCIPETTKDLILYENDYGRSSLDDHALIRSYGYAISAGPEPILYSLSQRTPARYIFEAGIVSGVTQSVKVVSLNRDNYEDAKPIVFAKMQTTIGTDPCTARAYGVLVNSFKVYLQEEKSRDTELEHAPEHVAYMVFKEGLIRDRDMQIIGEVGTVLIDNMKLSANYVLEKNLLGGSYKDPVVLMNLSTKQNTAYIAFAKLRKVYTHKFAFEVQDWEYQTLTDGDKMGMKDETVSYLIVEAGAHILSTGELLQATKVSGVRGDWVEVDFPLVHETDKPLAFAQVQHRNGTGSAYDTVIVRTEKVLANSCNIKLQTEQFVAAAGGAISEHKVGVISYSPNFV